MKTNNIHKIDSRKLSILVSPYGLSFMIKKSNEESKFFEYIFDKTNPFQLEEELKKIIIERPVLKHRFEEVNVIHHNLLNTLVPSELFDNENVENYLKYNITLLENDKASFDQLDELYIYNVYLPFANINNVFLNHNKFINYFHSSTVFIDKIIQERKRHQVLKLYDVYLNVYAKDFQLLIFKNEDILFYNSFEYETTDDFLYFFFFALESLNISNEDIQYHISGIDNHFKILNDLKDFVADWHIIKAKNESKINNFIL